MLLYDAADAGVLRHLGATDGGAQHLSDARVIGVEGEDFRVAVDSLDSGRWPAAKCALLLDLRAGHEADELSCGLRRAGPARNPVEPSAEEGQALLAVRPRRRRADADLAADGRVDPLGGLCDAWQEGEEYGAALDEVLLRLEAVCGGDDIARHQ